MLQLWFDPNLYGWIPGALYGCAAAVMAGFVVWLAPAGRARRAIVGGWVALWAAAVLLLAAGLLALAGGQPWGVWYSLLLPGVIGGLVVGATFFVILKKYREVERRRLAAKDLL